MDKSRPWNEGGEDKPYSVTLWDSHPDDENDDCSTGVDFATLEEARECIANLDAHFNPIYFRNTPYIMIDGPDVNEVILRPGHKAPKRGSKTTIDRDWQREIAMEAGMLHGIDAYNDEMGF